MVSEDLPPSYDEAIRNEESQGSSSRPEAPPPDYSSVPGRPSRPPRDEKRPPPKPPRTNSSTKPAKSSKPKPAAKPVAKPAAKPSRPAGNPNLPWTYPANYYCEKCHNTGYKLKNGKSCKRCWRRFATPNGAMPMNSGGPVMVTQPPPQSTYYSGLPMGDYFHPFGAPSGGYYQAAPVNTNALYVRPGDPRLGGVLCGECRGSGRVRFFLDEDLCPLCNGVGRIIR